MGGGGCSWSNSRILRSHQLHPPTEVGTLFLGFFWKHSGKWKPCYLGLKLEDVIKSRFRTFKSFWEGGVHSDHLLRLKWLLTVLPQKLTFWFVGKLKGVSFWRFMQGPSEPSDALGPPSTTTFLWDKPPFGLKHFHEGISDLESGWRRNWCSELTKQTLSSDCLLPDNRNLVFGVVSCLTFFTFMLTEALRTTDYWFSNFASTFLQKKFSIRSSWSKRPILSQHSQLQIFHLFLWLKNSSGVCPPGCMLCIQPIMQLFFKLNGIVSPLVLDSKEMYNFSTGEWKIIVIGSIQKGPGMAWCC